MYLPTDRAESEAEDFWVSSVFIVHLLKMALTHNLRLGIHEWMTTQLLIKFQNTCYYNFPPRNFPHFWISISALYLLVIWEYSFSSHNYLLQWAKPEKKEKQLWTSMKKKSKAISWSKTCTVYITLQSWILCVRFHNLIGL